MKVFLVAGARPNFMKIAPIWRASRMHPGVVCRIIHTGQHYDLEMSGAFFDDLDLPMPDFNLEAGSGSHAVQTAKIMTAFEEICQREMPDWVVVVGDVNSTLACSIVAKKLLIRVAHVEAGLRSFDTTMPEEINRMVTDSISDRFFVTEESGERNLLAEGKPVERIHVVGNVMIDNLLHQVGLLEQEDNGRFPTAALKRECTPFCFLTLHRPSNVDERDTFEGIAAALNEIAAEQPILFPVHPRTSKMMAQFDIRLSTRIHLLPPLGFRESLFLWKDADVVLTDSGGLQEETTAMHVPCVTIRENTERPVTVSMGSNILAGIRQDSIVEAYRSARQRGKSGTVPPYWDGKAAERIWDVLLKVH
ncbi:MAG: UDP-N-acetylglucosamine 2-epimerase (non-hydrolyzing) [Syntrophaceae bacterium]|jgi:UDP-N-acetylglucosamine 2-epimerase (non-hydrolysing)|nr:UDP-N-acetylglucosamine 2-epimerase (non-hydrolyzing) [Syntrophaceae bacterium]HOD72845.1 UDP-N-acetylglucosamine 2-epimerase (non-hydrolyzing) [Deltaproteobacteria bacterium]